MVRASQPVKDDARPGMLARPLEALVFLLPLIALYQVNALTRSQDQLIAFHLMRRFLELFGHAGVWAPSVAVIAILLATQFVSREGWSVRWRRVGWMYVEAVALCVPLLAINWWVARPVGLAATWPSFDDIALGIGAGVYEELVFRLGLICLILIIGVDLLRLSRPSVGVAAILLSSLAFAAHHHRPIGMEPFEVVSFLFRSVAGVYLAVVFWYRGYGPAAGCHAAYNVALACMNTSGT